ncbi:hypothetical protein BC936DRAFT_146340 [Jimgerdemannia flammicorona]|uniref:Uncharacterized protein n=1 Tax=Jimgerdemannia flammicorona TaxID=994334 RepID=A0A433D7V4_9FUNG|nr:hypothetical protein BC936DRAFT_146340 [Jimgerdemannia flammicorona]
MLSSPGRDDAPLQNGILEDDPNQHLLVHFEENCRKNFKHIEYDIYARDPPTPQPTEPDSSPPPSSEPQPVDVNSNSTSDHQPSDDPVPIPDTTTTTDLTTDTPTPSLTLITLDLSGLSNSPSTSPPTPTTLTTTLATHLRAFLPSPTSPTPSELLAIEHESRLLHLALPPTSSATLDLAPHVGRIRTLADLLTASRQYIIDFAPKVLLCRGQLVETLISSGVSRYLEFKGVEKSFIFEGEGGGVFEKVGLRCGKGSRDWGCDPLLSATHHQLSSVPLPPSLSPGSHLQRGHLYQQVY